MVQLQAGIRAMEYRVVIPDEVFAILQWENEGLPAVCVVNQALANFEPKVVFSWHLSIIVQCNELAENGMPTPGERLTLDQIDQEFDNRLKEDGNALFLARITWNSCRQLLYRVYDPEVANQYLTEIIESESQTREFEFRMEDDETWEHAKFYLSQWEDDPTIQP